MKTAGSIIILFLSIFFLNFMFLSNKKEPVLWAGGFPYINFKVNTSGFSINEESVVDSVKNSFDNLFIQTKTKIYFSYNGTTQKKSPNPPSSFNCSSDLRNSLYNEEKTIYSVNTEDPDCTGQACSFIWTCDNEILHFDIQFNNSDYKWSVVNQTDNYSYDLQTALSHELGHVSGLNHCLPQDTVDKCTSRLSSGHSNPVEVDVMYKFVKSGTIKRELSQDDKAGLQALYGEFKTSLSFHGDYALEKKDIVAISVELNLQRKNGLDTIDARQSQGESIKEIYDFINSGEINRTLEWEKIPGYTPGMSFEDYMNFSHNIIKNNLGARSIEELQIIRESLTSGIIVMDELMEKCSDCTGIPDQSLLNEINNKNIDLRKAVIDEQRRRQ